MDPLPRPVPDVAFESIEGEVVLVHLPTNRVYTLNRTGGRLWALLGQGLSRAEIVRELRREFAVGEQEVEREIDALLGALRDAGLVS